MCTVEMPMPSLQTCQAFKKFHQRNVSPTASPSHEPEGFMVEVCTSTGSYTMANAISSVCGPAPKLIPTPGYVSPASSNDNRDSPSTHGDLNEKEIHAVQQAQRFMSQLRARFEFDPARLSSIVHVLQQWKQGLITVEHLVNFVNGYLSREHDAKLRAFFSWFVNESMPYL